MPMLAIACLQMNNPSRTLSCFRRISAARLPLITPLLPLTLALVLALTGCSLPQISAESRIFLNVSLEFLGEYRLPKLNFEGTPVGGLSGITYDRQRDRFYAISDDRSEQAPARFYTLKLLLDHPTAKPLSAASPPKEPADSSASPAIASPAIGIQAVEVEAVTILKGENGHPFAKGTVDLEGIALSPRQSLFISSEGVPSEGIAPFIDEFDLKTGQWRGKVPIPARYLPDHQPNSKTDQPSGVQDNLGFESLTLDAPTAGTGQLEPFRLFTATESALQQDLSLQQNLSKESLQLDQSNSDQSNSADPSSTPTPVRLLHYLIGETQPLLLSEHVYFLDPPPAGATDNGLVELVRLDQGGHFLSLERSFGTTVGVNAQIAQIVTGGATDTSGITSLKGNLTGITPIFKRRLLDLGTLGISLDNLEGMTFGPRLADGTQSLLLVSDDNFSDLQATQFLLFRIQS